MGRKIRYGPYDSYWMILVGLQGISRIQELPREVFLPVCGAICCVLVGLISRRFLAILHVGTGQHPCDSFGPLLTLKKRSRAGACRACGAGIMLVVMRSDKVYLWRARRYQASMPLLRARAVFA